MTTALWVVALLNGFVGTMAIISGNETGVKYPTVMAIISVGFLAGAVVCGIAAYTWPTL